MKRIVITEKQLKLIKENEEKVMALADKLYDRFLENKKFDYNSMVEFGKKLQSMGVTYNERQPFQTARRFRLDHAKRSGKQLYQIVLQENVYATVDVTYVVDSDDPEVVREILENGNHLGDFYKTNPDNNDPIMNYENWDDDGTWYALESMSDEEIDNELEPYDGRQPDPS